MSETGRVNSAANDVAGPSKESRDAQPSIDDMSDSPREWPLLATQLEECRQIVELVHAEADITALRHQKNHRRLTQLAATFGTIAIVLAVIELSAAAIAARMHVQGSLEDLSEWLLGLVEATTALIALAAVVLGLAASRLDSWLIERHKAERCRLLKFAYLIDPSLWSGNEQKARTRSQRLREDVAAVHAIKTLEEPRKWLEQVHRPELPAESHLSADSAGVIKQLIAYYQVTRLRYQLKYFDERIARYRFKDHITRILPQWLFFFSVLAALLHFGLVSFEHLHGASSSGKAMYAGAPAAICAAALAAILPALGAGIRTYRMANEFGRNVKRFESAKHVLNEVDEWLSENADPKTVFLTLWTCEHVLEIEHREWLRLMAETEWFG